MDRVSSIFFAVQKVVTRALPVDQHNNDAVSDAGSAAAAGTVDMNPADPIEGMLIAQLVVANEAALSMYRRAWACPPDHYFEAHTKYLQLADKASRTVAMLTERKETSLLSGAMTGPLQVAAVSLHFESARKPRCEINVHCNHQIARIAPRSNAVAACKTMIVSLRFMVRSHRAGAVASKGQLIRDDPVSRVTPLLRWCAVCLGRVRRPYPVSALPLRASAF
jgi:hypothetical protein